ncbi:hypothetical protein TraAM80_10363 [Trypanosoma rangeli]|uniref:Uncharacterized protein n=1 Tax=Trypanosoma rangeli TaxID=5698 RepID=A0A3R7R2V4_TRYRA|nr:uncharacterized protein TraAM80_10363 [Trypanosoma rangeli]RNE95169.1 hypothetical protein TraAM80_10363 [Trypanosoma rangeli]|eukprot:RNE95169.1 hypothetical protein TraAM80_10363 [Trypanosoma rangeli]
MTHRAGPGLNSTLCSAKEPAAGASSVRDMPLRVNRRACWAGKPTTLIPGLMKSAPFKARRPSPSTNSRSKRLMDGSWLRSLRGAERSCATLGWLGAFGSPEGKDLND